MQPDQKMIDNLVRRIVEVAHPLRIILFGSAARGEMGPNSDVDVLVVVSEGTHRRHTAQRSYRHMIGFPLAVEEDSHQAVAIAEQVLTWASNLVKEEG